MSAHTPLVFQLTVLRSLKAAYPFLSSSFSIFFSKIAQELFTDTLFS